MMKWILFIVSATYLLAASLSLVAGDISATRENLTLAILFLMVMEKDSK